MSRVTDRPIPVVDPFNIVDPLEESYFWDQWDAVAQHNTAVYRRVFRPMPDNEVKTWSEYKEFFAFAERLAKAEGGEKGKMRIQQEQTGASGPVGALGGDNLLRAGKKESASCDNIKEHAEDGDNIVQDEKESITQDLKATKCESSPGKSELTDDMMHEESEAKDDAIHAENEAKDGVQETKDSMECRPSMETEHRRRARSSTSRAAQFTILPRETMEELLATNVSVPWK